MRGIHHRSPVNSSHKGQRRGALMFSLICAWINGWVNNREARDLRRQLAHYDVIVMDTKIFRSTSPTLWLLIVFARLENLFLFSRRNLNIRASLIKRNDRKCKHVFYVSYYRDVIMSVMAFPITGVSIVYSTVYLVAAQRKHQRSASLAFMRGLNRWPVNSLLKGPLTREMFPFDDVIV